MAFHELSYQKHSEHFEDDLIDANRIAISQSWFDKGTANHWRHARMYEAVDYFSSNPAATWLTIGDGRFGLDAIHVAEKGFPTVLPSDISESLLRKSKEDGRIADYAIENAEGLTFDDDRFDYVLCKEAYHHFPRPALALYEMLRVARNAVILIEPHDTSEVPIRKLKHSLKQLLRGPSHIDATLYEESGNYVYSITKREMEKVALGINLPMLATKGLNDHYVEGCEFEPASWKSSVYHRIRLKCAFKDLLARSGLHRSSLLMAVLFKRNPAQAVLSKFNQAKWDIVRLPRNPYV